jgi:hypothetical protein
MENRVLEWRGKRKGEEREGDVRWGDEELVAVRRYVVGAERSHERGFDGGGIEGREIDDCSGC